MLADTPDNLMDDICLLVLYDDSRLADTPENLMYDICLLGLYDDSR